MTTLIQRIQRKIATDQFEFSKHALDQSIIRCIRLKEIKEAIRDGEIIEDYPDDKYGASCLILGFTHQQRPIHIQCSYPTRPLIKIITLYEPDRQHWHHNLKQRRRSHHDPL